MFIFVASLLLAGCQLITSGLRLTPSKLEWEERAAMPLVTKAVICLVIRFK